MSPGPEVTVVVATYDRPDLALRLLRQLGAQTLAKGRFEVVVVDDGSREPLEPRLRSLDLPYALAVVRQANAGPAAARHRGIEGAAGDVVVILDDDMQVGPDFLERHLDQHPPGSRHAVLGRIRPDPGLAMPLYERYHAEMLERFARDVRAGRVEVHGTHLCTGNVSFRKADYLAVGGFDASLPHSEDAELGVRFDRAGVRLVFSEEAATFHASPHASLAWWMRRSRTYGVCDTRISRKHPETPWADPWRFLFLVHPLSRPLLLLAALLPALGAALAWTGIAVAQGVAALGLERLGLAGATLVYGLQYFRGVRHEAGSLRRAVSGLLGHLARRDAAGLGPVALAAKLAADIRADYGTIQAAEAKYHGRILPSSHLLFDLVRKIGFQMTAAYRVMRFLRWLRLGLLARVVSRLIRHLYGADVHWDAELAPGVMIVHGVGLVVSHSARVGPGCVLFQHVTLGESFDAKTGRVGAPTLEANVHVGPGAMLLGPITVGRDSKVTGGALLMQTVSAGSLVETPAPTIRSRRPGGTQLLAGLLLLGWLGAACHPAQARETGPGTRAETAYEVAETIYDGGLSGKWKDWGWAPREIKEGPARLKMAGKAGWIVARPGLEGTFGALVFRFVAPAEFGDFLEVHLGSSRNDAFPSVSVGPQHRRDVGGGATEVLVPMRELNPHGLAFDRVVLRARVPVDDRVVALDKIALTRPGPEDARPAPAAEAPAVDVALGVDCSAPAHAIDPMIYGIAFDNRLDAKHPWLWSLAPGARRWGGNTASRYNWELGNAWNTANDWFFRNTNFTNDPSYTYDKFLDKNLERGVKTALTVPTIGWVAKDTESHSFPVSVYGPQQSADPYRGDAGNGRTKDGKPVPPGPATRTSVAMPPESIGRWVAAIREKDARRGRSVHQYILDNEPMLWHDTHRDAHPEPTSYDELLERTIAYGTAVRKADPGAVIAGPALWGWPAYFFSAVDAGWGFTLRPDRLRHGNVPLLPWWLRQLRRHEKETGVRLVDVVDVHFYPMADRVGGRKGGTDPETAAKRLRSTRALWDPSYRDESWIDDVVKLIPRLRAWIDEEYPGLGISIGEWNFGAEDHVSGGLAVAEALGRFGEAGITSAFYWTYPAQDTPAYWAFRAYRDYDGDGASFQDSSVRTRTEGPVSLFASRNPEGTRLVAVALNLDPERAARARFDVGTCGAVTARRTFTYATGSRSLVQAPASSDGGAVLEQTLAPYSINVLEIDVAPRSPAR